MATVTKDIADRIIAGEFREDPPAIRIVEYTNAFDGRKAYGVIYRGESWYRYRPSDFVINPVTYWQRAPLYCREPDTCNGSCRRDIACNE